MAYSLYRHFAADGTLLYVGISLSALKRLGQHQKNSEWFKLITRVEIEQHPDKVAAKAAEKHAIQTEHPKHNTHWQVKPANAPRFCSGCGTQVFNANRKLCSPCRKKANQVASENWRARHPTKQVGYRRRHYLIHGNSRVTSS